MALRSPSLADERRFCRSNHIGKFADLACRNLGDRRRPFGGLLNFIVAGAHDVVLVGLVLALCGLGHRIVIVADAVLVEKFLVDLVALDPLVSDGRHESSVGARANGKPLVGMT